MCKSGHGMLGLGITLVTLGSLSTILGIVAAAAFKFDVFSRVCGPIWAGVFVVVTGSMGIMAGRNFNREGSSKGFTVAFLTLSIFGIFVAMSQVIVSGAGVAVGCFIQDLEKAAYSSVNDDIRDSGGLLRDTADMLKGLEDVTVGYPNFNDFTLRYPNFNDFTLRYPSFDNDNWNNKFNDDDDNSNVRITYDNGFCSSVALHYTCLALGLLEMILCFASSIMGCVVGCTCCNPQPGPSVLVMQQPSNLPYAQMPDTVTTVNNPVAFPQAAYMQQPPPAYLPPGQQLHLYPAGGVVTAAQQQPAVPAPTEQVVKAQPV